MEFEYLLAHYLDGSLGDAELERFQMLLDRVPEYKRELRETLEIRSLLHDDALTLSVPVSLADHVRIAVGSSFAADAIDAEESATLELREEEHKRRGAILPLRIAAGTLVALCLTVGVALTPSLRLGMADNAPIASNNVRSAETRSGVVDGTITLGAISSDQAPAPDKENTPRKRERSSRSVITSRVERPRTSSPNHAQRSEPSIQQVTEVATTAITADSAIPDVEQVPAIIIEPLAQPPSIPVTTDSSGDAPAEQMAANNWPTRSLSLDVQQLSQQEIAPRGTGIADLLHHDNQLAPDRVSMAMPGPNPSPSSPDEFRRLAFGVTVGSGQVASSGSVTPLLQNSYYFAFGVSSHDRIGVEMGASAFEREGRLQSVPASASSPLAKGSVGSPDNDTPVRQPSPSRPTPQTELVYERFEQQITYGAVFYDRRIPLTSSWDICGRVTLGGADASVVGNVRCYAAYTPAANKNITLTLGVGGAGLFDLTARGNTVSGNYGIYYGIETGF